MGREDHKSPLHMLLALLGVEIACAGNAASGGIVFDSMDERFADDPRPRFSAFARYTSGAVAFAPVGQPEPHQPQ